MNDQKLAVSYRPVSGLIPYANNARTHSDAQVAQIASSIRAFGWTNPILVDGESGIIAGHGWLDGSGRRFAASTEKPQAADSKIG